MIDDAHFDMTTTPKACHLPDLRTPCSVVSLACYKIAKTDHPDVIMLIDDSVFKQPFTPINTFAYHVPGYIN